MSGLGSAFDGTTVPVEPQTRMRIAVVAAWVAAWALVVQARHSGAWMAHLLCWN